MIDLNRKRYLDPIAYKWLGWIKGFINQKHTNGFKPSLAVGDKTLHFQTHEEKLKFLCRQNVFKYSKSKKEQRYYFRLLDILWKNIDYIILATPPQIEDMMEIWLKRKSLACKYLKQLSGILEPYYEKVADKYGGKLVSELGIKTCPYCNRQFIHAFKGQQFERPELDHFFPKAIYPIFCLSFYNLIPVCHSCNHVKREKKIGVNPYHNAFKSTFIITDKKDNKISKSKIYHLAEKEIRLRFENPTPKEQENIAILGLEDVYDKHTDYVKELIDKSMAYDTYARKALVESFQGAGWHPRQVYDFVWGRHLMNVEYEDRPLSKLTKDILDLLDIRRG